MYRQELELSSEFKISDVDVGGKLVTSELQNAYAFCHQHNVFNLNAFLYSITAIRSCSSVIEQTIALASCCNISSQI